MCCTGAVSFQPMAIVTYFAQLETAARQLEGDTEMVLRRAFDEAGVPSSTFYRAKHGAELKGSTAKKVATVLFQQAREGRAHGQRDTASRAADAA